MVSEAQSCINFREKWRGHLWQERFSSFPMDENHLPAAARYIETNPVASGLVARPEEYRWSSARAHLAGEADGLVDVAPLLALVPDWQDFLALASTKSLTSYIVTNAPAVPWERMVLLMS